MLGLFFMPVPITMKQGYLIVTGIVVAYIFTLIPEWTTWVLLVAMALYDLCAVLTPGGPLKVGGTAGPQALNSERRMARWPDPEGAGGGC